LLPGFLIVRILHVGNASVVAPLRALGHEVLVALEMYPELDVPGRPFDVRALWPRLGAKPDVLLVVDTLGRQTLPYGVEEAPALRVYYAIDVHLNYFWQRHYGSLFDLVLVAQKDYVPLFESAGVPAYWLPFGVEGGVFRDLGLPRIYDLSFVGIVDAGNRPKRAAAVELLQQRFGLMLFGGTPEGRLSAPEMARVFAASKIVFNESVLGDLNFRVFEAMACGALLLTERVGNGLTDLFTPGEHLDVYAPETLLAKVAYYLDPAHEAERARIAAAGARLVHARHTAAARMAELATLLDGRIARRAVARAAFHWGATAGLTVLRGLVDPQAGMKSAAESLRAAALDHADADAAVALAELMVWTGRMDGALALLAEARRLEPAHVRAWLLAGEIERRRARPAEAAALLRGGVEAAADLAPSTRARALAAIDRGVDTSACWLALGDVACECGFPFVAGLIRHVDDDPPRIALDYYVRAVETDAGNRAAAERAAALLEFMGAPEFAARFYESIVGLVPHDVAVRERLCDLLARSFQHAALTHHRRVLTVLDGGAPDGNREERARAYHEAGIALRAGGSPARAVAALEQAAACVPGRIETISDVALARLDAGDHAGAAAWLERALESVTVGREEIATLLALVRDRLALRAPP
jgi:tetratricopeptide (TPR) repeat protein